MTNREVTRDPDEEHRVAIGIAWYSREGWERMRAVAADPDSFENSYEAWLAMITRSLKDLESQGVIPEKVELDANRVAAWCKERGRPIDASSRSEYVSRYLTAKYGSPHKSGGI